MALDRLTKVDGGGISTTSDYRVGIITASKFVGPFDGSGGNFSGVVTATNGVFSGNISAVDGNFSGNVTIGGTLTYEDVTNIDSVGLVTAREGISLPDNKVANFGNSNDLMIYHTGTHGYIKNKTNNLYIMSTNTEYGIEVHGDGKVRLNYDNIPKIETTSSGINVIGVTTTTGLAVTGVSTFTGNIDANGDLDVDGHTNLDNGNVAGIVTFNSGAALHTDGGQILLKDRPDGGSNNLFFGTGGKAVIYHDGTNFSQVNNTGHFYLGQGVGNKDLMLYAQASGNVLLQQNTGVRYVKGVGSDASVQLFYNNNLRLNTTDAGVSIPKDLDVDGHTNLDNVSIAGVTTFSTSPVVPNGTYYKGIINSGSQEKIVGGYISGSNTLRLGESMYLTMNPERLGLGISDPQRTLHLSSNNTVIALTDTAAGTNQKTKYILSDAGVFAVGKLSDDYNTATEHLYIDNNGLVIINRGGNGGTADVNADNFVVKNYESSSSCGISILNADNQNSTLYFGNASDSKHAEVVWSDVSNLFLIGTSNTGASIKFRVANQADALTIDSNGHLLPGAAGAQNLGSTSAEWGDVYIADDKKLYLGSSQDVEIYHSSGNVTMFDSTTNRQVQLKGDGGLLIRAGGNQNIANFVQSGVTLYHSVGNNYTARFVTTSTGITVTGEVASTQDYPDFRPTLDLNFAAVRKLDPRVSYDRTGPASFVNEFGKIVLVGGNVPRFDHNPVTRESKGLLIEEERTNYAVYSTTVDYTDGNYNMINSAVLVSDAGEAPDGTNTATKMYPNSSGSARGIEDVLSLPSTGEYTTSVYVKAAGHTGWIALYSINGSTRAYFNPTTGAAGQPGTYPSTPAAGKFGIEDAGNGWYRCHLTVNLTSTGGAEYFYIYFGDSDGSVNVTSSGQNGILMWGLQIEKGSFPTSYIPTEATTATRGADQTYIDGQDFLDFYNQTEGTVISSHSILDHIPSTHNLYTYQISPTGATAYAPLRLLDKNGSYGNSLTAASVYNNSTIFLVQPSGSPATVAGRKMLTAVSIKKDDYDASFNGEDVQSDSSGDLYTADHISIGYYKPSPQAYLNGHIQRLIYYPTKLSNSQLKTLTS